MSDDPQTNLPIDPQHDKPPLRRNGVRRATIVGALSPWRGRQTIRWSEVERLSYNLGLGYFVVCATDGRKFRISALVAGLNTFLETCERDLSVEQLRPAKHGYNYVGRPFPENKTKT